MNRNEESTTMGILYLLVLAIAVLVGAVVGGFIGLTIGLMSAPFTYACVGLAAGGLLGFFVGVVFLFLVHQRTVDNWLRR
jgi:hypothetical protein